MEVYRMQCEMADIEKAMVVFPSGQRKGKRGRRTTKRVIYIHPSLLPMVKRRVEAQGTGPLFTTGDGRAWNKDIVRQRISRMSKHLEFTFCLTDLRHTWCTRFLKGGGTIAEASAAMGRSSPRMAQQVYGHLEQDAGHIHRRVSATRV